MIVIMASCDLETIIEKCNKTFNLHVKIVSRAFLRIMYSWPLILVVSYTLGQFQLLRGDSWISTQIYWTKMMLQREPEILLCFCNILYQKNVGILFLRLVLCIKRNRSKESEAKSKNRKKFNGFLIEPIKWELMLLSHCFFLLHYN